ncbi:LTA synthase family protein [Jeotgalibacillus haloalkalitolerans]|uniref:LTA synthase family protein n=1 Tax=Jeotgalibacillus haloalkalitolerans TaxID=3104292 RepID=A0ABU5KLL7_9BACL|nr:LTA synthase family protein [Jeotgalibacillus sp. HH7-29]MDZ5712162.1 LTA synthase family protein [Jeotgalibacillus sp. HH7-29]
MNKRWSMPKLSLVIIAIAFLWIKTFIAYHASFNISTDNFMQDLILFINPLSFLLLIFGVGLLFKKEKTRNNYVIITSFVLTTILFANMVFYRFFNDFITLPVLFQTNNFGDLGGSAMENIYMTDALYFIDVLILIVLAKYKPSFMVFKEPTKLNRRAYFLVAIATFFLNLGLAETERPQLLTRTFDREMLVKNIGTYNYHIYDVYLQSKQSAQRALADSDALVDVNNYVQANKADVNNDLHGIGEGKNLIVVKLESMQNFVINNEMNGEVITPFLNTLTEDENTIYMDNFYHQTEQGKTSDSEFLLDNSLYPLGRGAVFFTHSGNEYNTLTDSLNEAGYYTNAMHANNKSFWNRDIVYDNFGYDRYYSLTDYTVGEGQAVNWGMKDIPFFEQSVEHMKEMEQPFYSKMITLTNHHPFYLDEEDKFINEFDSNSGTLNRYFQTVRYQDEAIKEFFTNLKEAGLYEDSVIVMYGDHYGISENHNAAMAQYLEQEEITAFDTAQLQRVPMFIHIPGEDIGETNSKIAGQIDLKPTIQNIMGIEGSNSIQFGQDIFSEENDNTAILRDGRVISEDLVYAGETCWDKESGEPVEKESCQPLIDKATEELAFNDEIIYGDLLRFYDTESGRLLEDTAVTEE